MDIGLAVLAAVGLTAILFVAFIILIMALILNAKLNTLGETVRRRFDKLEAKLAKDMPGETSNNKPETVAETSAGSPRQAAFQKTVPGKPAEASAFERNAGEALRKIWNWILAGEERKEVSLEYAIATTWLVRGAIVIILAAIAFGINYSVQHGLLSPAGRITLGFLTGLVMTGLGLSLRKGSYRTAGHGLLGGGLAALYFSAFAAAMIYHLIEPGYAFALMALITAGSCGAALLTSSPLVALIGTLGGYLTPIVISSGEKHLVALFVYLALLGCGLLYIARKRDWPLLQALSLLFNYIVLFSALEHFYDKTQDYGLAITAGTVLFLIFSLAPLLYNILNKRITSALELILLVGNATAYLILVHKLTIELHPEGRVALFCLALALYHALFAWLLVKNKDSDKGLFDILCAFAAFFVAYAIPLIIGGCWIIAAWSLEALTLFWLAKGIGGKFLEKLGLALFTLATLRLILLDLPDSFLHLHSSNYWRQMPSRIGISAFFIGSLAAAGFLGRRNTLLATALVALFLYLTLEVGSYTSLLHPDFCAGAVSVLWGLFALGMLIPGIKGNSTALRIAGLLLFLATAFKIFLFDLASLSQLARIAAFAALGLATLAGAFVYMKFRSAFEKPSAGDAAK